MIGDVLKVVEMLVNALKGYKSPEHKRAALAKDLMEIHMLLVRTVRLGRQILNSVDSRSGASGPQPIYMLSEQLGNLRELQRKIGAESISDIVQLHLPHLKDDLEVFIDEKVDRVWIMLDHLVSDGEDLSPREWAAHMQGKMGEVPSNARRMAGGLSRPLSKVRQELIVEWEREDEPIPFLRRGAKKANTTLLIDRDHIRRGYALLDQIDAVNEQLRIFLVEKFKLEDTL